jgi:polysaccharide biosynthesis protein PslH
VRILVVGQTFPWPPTSGAKIRLANVISALAALGQTDLFAFAKPEWLHETGALDLEAAGKAGIDRMEVVPRPHSELSGLHRVSWFAGGRQPMSLAGRNYGHAVDRFSSWTRGQYDFVWNSRVETYLSIGRRLQDVCTVVDVDDLQDHLLVSRFRVRGDDDTSALARRLATPVRRLQMSRDARLWKELYARVSASVDAVVVCSDLDRDRLGAANGVVLPNGYEPPERPLGRSAVGTPPTVLFPGFLQYGPNVDAAHFLVEKIGPALRQKVPHAQIRLVGRVDGRVQRLNDPPAVVVTGPVPDIAAELARADVVAVPLRYGSGTRIKILEAFAHRIPVVSTTVGVEGIDATDDVHLFVRDTPNGFAAACAVMLVESSLRNRLVSAAHGRLLERYRWSVIREQIRRLAGAIADGTGAAVGASVDT